MTQSNLVARATAHEVPLGPELTVLRTLPLASNDRYAYCAAERGLVRTSTYAFGGTERGGDGRRFCSLAGRVGAFGGAQFGSMWTCENDWCLARVFKILPESVKAIVSSND